MKLEEILCKEDLSDLDGEYRVTINSGKVSVEACDSSKQYLLALEQKITHSSGWMFWLFLFLFAGTVGFANSQAGKGLPFVEYFQGWGPGLAIAVACSMGMVFISNQMNKTRAKSFAEEFAEESSKLNLDINRLLSEDWFDKQAFTVKSSILNGTFKTNI